MQNKTLKLGNMYITKENVLHSDHIVKLKFRYQNASEEVCHNLVKKKKEREKKEKFMEPPPVIKKIASDTDTIWCHYSYMDQVDSSAS